MSEAEQPAQTGAARSVIRGTLLLATSRVLDRASTFVIVIVIAARLGPVGVGAFSAAMALYGAFMLAGQAGTTNFLVREISRDPRRTAPYIVHLSMISLVASLVVVGGLELAIPHLGYARVLRASTEIVVLAIPASVLGGVQEAAFLAHRRVEFETLTTLACAAIYIGASVALLLSHHGITSLMWTYVALEWAAAAVYFGLITRFIARLRMAIDRRLAWKLMREIRTFAASSLIQALFIRPELVVLSLMSSTAQVGYYGAAVRVAELPQFIPDEFMANVFPLMSAAHPGDERRFAALQARAVRAVLAFSLPVTALLLAAAPEIVSLLFGARFRGATGPLRVLAVTVLFASLISVFWRSLAARGRQDAVLRVQLLAVAVRVGGGAALIAPLAALGAGIAAAASYVIQAGLLVAGVARAGVRTSLSQPLRRLAPAAVVCGGVTWGMSDLAGIWPALPAGALAYLATAILSGGISAEDRALLGRPRSST